ncbi:hypothetical protein HPB49_005752 [Dermacentor silvarum]|uniref:Uncharacterized protein n=1 Tax=Dermacentor silvarum TaxID=543639 RepID=A0ACB8C7J0_DERSI|nr:hypothetical protein HPB49_005752 [Dermacentor silvarum]
MMRSGGRGWPLRLVLVGRIPRCELEKLPPSERGAWQIPRRCAPMTPRRNVHCDQRTPECESGKRRLETILVLVVACEWTRRIWAPSSKSTATGHFDLTLSKLPSSHPGRLFTAICAATKIPLQEALAQDQVRLHPANNTFTISTPVEARARTYAQITSITIGTNSTDATAYLAPPDDAVRGVIHMAHSGESHAEIINGLVPFNPELPIIDARSFGKKRSIIITFATGPLPKAIRFWAGVHTCFPHRPKMETCYNCRRIGHRQDVCPAPASGCCHNCGETHTPTDPPTCPPKCIVCGDGHHTGNIQCKYRYARPQPRTTQPATGHQSRTREQTPAPRKSSRSASSARSASRDRSNKPRQDLTWADRVRKSPPASTQKIPDHNEGELRALREELGPIRDASSAYPGFVFDAMESGG